MTCALTGSKPLIQCAFVHDYFHGTPKFAVSCFRQSCMLDQEFGGGGRGGGFSFPTSKWSFSQVEDFFLSLVRCFCVLVLTRSATWVCADPHRQVLRLLRLADVPMTALNCIHSEVPRC